MFKLLSYFKTKPDLQYMRKKCKSCAYYGYNRQCRDGMKNACEKYIARK